MAFAGINLSFFIAFFSALSSKSDLQIAVKEYLLILWFVIGKNHKKRIIP